MVAAVAEAEVELAAIKEKIMMKELQGKGKRLQRKGKAGNMTAAILAIPPPPAKKAKTPTDKVCYSHIVISSLTL
jgi:hypothetical protein